MTTITGHLTQTDKKAIRSILDGGFTEGKVGRKSYYLSQSLNGEYVVLIKQVDRGCGFFGSPLRVSTYTSIIKL